MNETSNFICDFIRKFYAEDGAPLLTEHISFFSENIVTAESFQKLISPNGLTGKSSLDFYYSFNQYKSGIDFRLGLRNENLTHHITYHEFLNEFKKLFPPTSDNSLSEVVTLTPSLPESFPENKPVFFELLLKCSLEEAAQMLASKIPEISYETFKELLHST